MNDFTDIVSKVMEVSPDDGDYTGEDGLLYCGKCHTPKEAYFEDGRAALFGRDRHPTNCACQQKRYMERGTDYGLEQVYNVIDSRYRSGKPLIVTTNLSLDELQHPQDTPHARIYDRLLEMCAPILFTGTNFRRQTAQSKLDRLKTMMKEKECL